MVKKQSNFDKLANSVAKQYEKKGMSESKAKEVGAAVDAKVGMQKYGKEGMAKKAAAGKAKAKGK